MAGNKKPRRKLGAKSGSDQSKVRAMVKGMNQGRAERQKRVERCNYLNSLPMSHPVSCHMIEKTMKPLERFLADHERTGGYMVEEGEPVLWDGKDWIKVIPGVLHMCFVYERMARACTWPVMPPGLRVYALGLQMGRDIDADDFEQSRVTIAWMRQWMGTLTPLKWQELFDWAENLDEKNAAQDEAEAAHG